MPYSRELYENMPLYARLFDARTGELLRHICDAIQVEFDVIRRLMEEYEYLLFLPGTLNEGFLDFLQQYVGLGYEGADRWIGVAIKPDWPTWRKKNAIASAWEYWRSKGTESGIRKAYEIWCEWDEAFDPERLELRMPFGDHLSATPPQWWGWGTPYDAHLTELYADRKHLGGAYKPGFEYQPPGILLEYPRWRWDYAETWSPRVLDAFLPAKKINSQHGMGPREVWEHFKPDLDDLDFFEWNEIFRRVRELHSECWPAPYLPRIWAWLERTEPVGYHVDRSLLAPGVSPEISVEWDVGGINWGDLWRFPIYSPASEIHVVEEESVFRDGFRWDEGLFPGTGGEARRDPTNPEDLKERECQIWYGATWGDPQDLRAIFRDIGSWVPVSRGGSRLGWGELWNSLPWYHPGATEMRWIVATHRFGPFEPIAGEPWFAESRERRVEKEVLRVPGGFNAVVPTWGKLTRPPGDGGSGDDSGDDLPGDAAEDRYAPPDPRWRRVELRVPTDGNWPATARWGTTSPAEPVAGTPGLPESPPISAAIAGEIWGSSPWAGDGGEAVEIAPPEASANNGLATGGAGWGTIPRQGAGTVRTASGWVSVDVAGSRREWGDPWATSSWPHPDRAVAVRTTATWVEPIPKPAASRTALWPARFPDAAHRVETPSPMPGGFESDAASWGGAAFPNPEWVEIPVLEGTDGTFGRCQSWSPGGAAWGDIPDPADEPSPEGGVPSTQMWTDGRDGWLFWLLDGRTQVTAAVPGNADSNFRWGVPWTVAHGETDPGESSPIATVVPDNADVALGWDGDAWGEGSPWWRNREVSVEPAPPGQRAVRSSRPWLFAGGEVEIRDPGYRGNWGGGSAWARSSGSIPADSTNAPAIGAGDAGTPYYRKPAAEVVGSRWVRAGEMVGNTLTAAPQYSEGPIYLGTTPGNSSWGDGRGWYRDWPPEFRTEIATVAEPVEPIAGNLWATKVGDSQPDAEPETRWVPSQTAGVLWGAPARTVSSSDAEPPDDPGSGDRPIPGAWGALAVPAGLPPAEVAARGAEFPLSWTSRDGRSPWLAWAFGRSGDISLDEPDNRGRCAAWGVPWTATSGESQATAPPPGIVRRDNWRSAQRWGTDWGRGSPWFRNRETVRPTDPLATADLRTRASRPWYVNLRKRTLADSGERHSWGAGRTWRSSSQFPVAVAAAPAIADVSRPYYFAPGERSDGFAWIESPAPSPGGDSPGEGAEEPPGGLRHEPPSAAEFALPARSWDAGAGWYWESPELQVVVESAEIVKSLAFPGIPWQKNLTVTNDYDPANYPPIWREWVTPGDQWYADSTRTVVRTIQIPGGEDWEIGGADGKLVVGEEVEWISEEAVSGATLLIAEETPPRQVVGHREFGGVQPGFGWGDIYPRVSDGEFPFQVYQPMTAPACGEIRLPESWDLEDAPSINMVGDLSNLVADWTLFGSPGEKIRWHVHCWQAPPREGSELQIPGWTDYVLPEKTHMAEYGDRNWSVVGLWGIFAGEGSSSGRAVAMPVVADVWFPNLFGFWAVPELVGRREVVSPPDDVPPVEAYPDLAALGDIRNWEIAVEIDGDVKLIRPVTFFWASGDRSGRSLRYSESRPFLTLEFAFEPDVDDPRRDWGYSEIRGTALMFRGEMLDYRSYDWYGRLTSHDSQAVGVRYAVEAIL